MWIQVDSWLGNATTIGYYSCQFAAMGCKIGWFKLWSRKGLLPNLFKLKDLSCKTFLCKTMRERGVFFFPHVWKYVFKFKFNWSCLLLDLVLAWPFLFRIMGIEILLSVSLLVLHQVLYRYNCFQMLQMWTVHCSHFFLNLFLLKC